MTHLLRNEETSGVIGFGSLDCSNDVENHPRLNEESDLEVGEASGGRLGEADHENGDEGSVEDEEDDGPDAERKSALELDQEEGTTNVPCEILRLGRDPAQQGKSAGEELGDRGGRHLWWSLKW